MEKQGTMLGAGLSDEDLDLLAYVLEEEGVELARTPHVPRRALSGEAPLSFAQQRMWFLEKLQPGNPVYHLPTAVRVTGRLDVAALERTFEEIVRRHESLRTTFDDAGGEPRQIIGLEARVALPLVDLGSLPEGERQREAARLTREEVARPFDLARGPLLRTLLLRTGAEEHVVVVTMHHIISDGWSGSVFVREVGALYEAFTKGEPSPLEELSVQYADFAEWQREWLQGDALEEQLSYWRAQLGGLQMVELPFDRPRPAEQSFRGAKLTETTPREVAESLGRLGQAEGATPFMVLLAAFAALLSRYGGQTEVTVGTPVANRRRAELEPLIGFFVNTLVLRLDTSGGPTFRELVRRAREVCLGAYAHQDLPFEKLVEELQPERSLSHTPLFQVLFVLQNVPRSGLDLEGLRLEGVAAEAGAAKFDLTLVAEETGSGVVCTFEYNTDLFEDETVRRMSDHFGRLLEAAAAEPDRPFAELQLLGEDERRLALVEWNDTRREYPRGRHIHELFEEQARRTPDAIALVFEGARLTYAELDVRANQLARHLRTLGAGPDVLVGVAAERSIEMVVALLGVLKAGAAYVPLDPDYPRERLDFMLRDAAAPVLLTQARLAERFSGAGARVVLLDAEWETVAREDASSPNVHAAPESLAYVIYTSGSTGRPKGVMVEHAGILNRLQWMQEAYGLDSSDTVLQKTPFSFDVSVWEFFWPLLTGARLVVARPGGHQDAAYLVELIKREGVTTLHFVPPMLRLFLEEPGAGECESLRRVICSGEALPAETRDLFFELLSAELHNLYGPTEASVDVTHWACRKEHAGQPVPIGRPVANTQMYVLDAAGRPAPVRVAGELHIGGVQLARGYLNRPSLTAERFIPDPYSSEPGARLYKTGDLARHRADGAIEFLGRIDNQVKIRGFRIELGEIEASLSSHSSVRECVVVAREDAPGEKRLVAYVVADGGGAASLAELREHLSKRLPDYMTPSHFIFLEAFPLSPNGKLDRRALPAPSAARPGAEESYVAPRTETEDLLASIWADVLGLERVGVDDNFFALGGDSIRSVRLLARARERGLDFSLQQLFRHQSIAALAREAKAAEGGSLDVPRTAPFQLVSEEDRARMPEDLVDAYPLTMLQGGMLFHMALTPDAALYHNVNSWHLRAPFDRARFEDAVARAVARHPVLRTSFDLTSYAEPTQLVHAAAKLEVGVEDLRGMTGEEQGAALDRFVESERTNAFDLSRPPLVRFHIHLRTDESFQFTLAECHPIFDGWSLNSTLSEIFTDYFALLRGESHAPAPPASVTFRDYVLLERQALASEEHTNFWEERLRGLNATRLPRLPAHYRDDEGERIRQEYFLASPELSRGLQAVARSLGVPVKSVLLAAHLKVLSALCGERDVTSGLVTNGRPEAVDGEQVRGLFLNTVPFRLRLPEGSWSDLVRATFEAEWELLPYRRYPLPALQRRAGGQPLFEAQFNFVHFHVLEGVLRSGEVEVLNDVKRVYEEAHFPLTAAFGLNLFSAQVNLMLQYDARQLTGEQARAVRGYYEETLRRIAEEPRASHDARTPLPREERKRLLTDWNDTTLDFSSAACLHELFERQAARTPAAVAVERDGGSMSYAELNARANRLARHLRTLGVGPDVRVALLAERSIEMVVALLGVLKAGGAYVPLDPDYPAERINFMLEDSGARVLLTQEKFASGVARGGAEVVFLDSAAQSLARERAENLPRAATPDGLAYVIYTSGSTGKPKGVMVPHRGVVNCVEWMQQTYMMNARDKFLFKTSLNFDASVWEVFWPLAVGASVFVARPGGQQDAAYLADVIARRRVSFAYFVPSMLSLFLDEPGLARAASLRKVICGGESLPGEMVRRFQEMLPAAELHHSYGPTETSIAASEFLCTREGEWQVTPIGRPLGNYSLYILDEALEPAPVATTGELYVGGVGVARGYHGRASLTAERFIPDPFSTEPGARLYKTGDLARYLPDGNVEFRGRADAQVKLRGMRIEPGEIEAALAAHARVRECAVVQRGEGLAAALVAYVVAHEGERPTIEELREHLSERLPRHMVPSAFVLIEALPLMPNGKVDRKALPEHDASRASAVPVEFVAPRNEMERAVADIWREVLGLEQVGVDDNFFDIGGHSLRLLQVHLKLRQQLGRELPLAELFQYPTVGALARHLLEGGEGESLAESGQRGERRKRSAAQQRQRRNAVRAGAGEQGA